MTNRKKIMLGLLGGMLVSAVSHADILTFEINQTHSQGGSSSDIPRTSISLGGAGSFDIDPGFSGTYFDFTFDLTGTFSTIDESSDGCYFLDSYIHGETVGVGNFGTHVSVDDWDTILSDDTTGGSWSASHSGYLGFKTDANLYGWISYDFTRSGSISTMQLNDGAYNDISGENISAGMVPEPATAGLLVVSGLMIAGYRRIRKAYGVTR